VIVAVAALALPAVAGAKHVVLIPPGNSALSQYVETVPTAHGGQPAGTIMPRGPGGSGGIPSSTLRALASSGPTGRSAAAAFSATAPAARHKHARVRAADLSASGSSPLDAVIRALTGSSSSGGMGALLPILLAGILVVLSGVLVLRRRRAA
jgi:hypothetical protein